MRLAESLNDQGDAINLTPEGVRYTGRKHGITPDTTVVFYGETRNCGQPTGLWVFSLFGHKDYSLLMRARQVEA